MVETNGSRGSWKGVAESIRRRIAEGVYPEGTKLPSEGELMRDHGASKMTVHRALRELASEGLVRRVERVGTFALGVPTSAVRKIGLVLPTSAGSLEFNLLAGVRAALNPGDQYLLYATENDPVAEAEALQRVEKETDGVLILPSGHPRTARRLRDLHEGGFPVVCVDRACPGYDLPAVTSNNFDAAYAALKAVAEGTPGRLAYFGIYDEGISSLVDRYRAYETVCRERGQADFANYARFVPPGLGAHAAASYRLLEDSLLRLLGGDDPVRLAFCANEFYLEAIVQICHELPHALWRDLQIVSFNDWPRMRYRGFRVHTLRQNAHEVGRRAANLLHAIWQGGRIDPLTHEVAATFVHADEPDDFTSLSDSLRRPGLHP